jgi:polyisoprenoid-binding protein YceI
MPPRSRPFFTSPVSTRLLARGAALVLLLAATAAAASERYRLDPVHTRVLFSVSHAGFSQALGTVSGATGTVEFDPGDWSSARMDVRVPLLRLDLGDGDWNRATLAANLLDGQRWPAARFVSRQVQPHEQDRFSVHGDLTLRGVTRPVVLEVRMNALRRHPLPPFRRTAGFSATTTLSRSQFGITAWKSMIGDEVQIQIQAEAVRDRDAPDIAPDTGPGHDDPAAADEQSPSEEAGTDTAIQESISP